MTYKNRADSRAAPTQVHSSLNRILLSFWSVEPPQDFISSSPRSPANIMNALLNSKKRRLRAIEELREKHQGLIGTLNSLKPHLSDDGAKEGEDVLTRYVPLAHA